MNHIRLLLFHLNYFRYFIFSNDSAYSISIATKNTKMNVSNSQWSKVLLNNTKELMKKHSTNVTRRLFSKMNSPALKKQSSKSAIYKRYLNKSKRFSPRLKNTPRHSPKFSEWKTEYDVWNMVVNAIDKNVSNASRENCQSNVFGVRDLNDNIRLIENRREFNDQILVCSNGIKTKVDQLLSPSDSAADVSLKIKIKMVPVIEEVTLVRNSRETSYTFDAGTNDINNNAMECQDIDTEQQKEEDDDIDRTLSFGDETLAADEIDDNEFDRTIMNVMSETEYSIFFNELQPEACSTFISQSKENQPFVAIPKK